MNKEDLDKIPVFFIVGKGRSGTTLLQRMLNSHPSVCVPMENRLFSHLYTKYNKKILSDKKDKSRFLKDALTEIEFNFWITDFEKTKTGFLSCDDYLTFSNALKLLLLSATFDGDKTPKLLGDKKPLNTLFFARILKVFPQAQFIHLVRDYRANAYSHINNFPLKDLGMIGLRWNFFNDSIEKQKSLCGNKFITIKYENLVVDPEKTLHLICKFLDLSYSPDMLNFELKQNDSETPYYYKKVHSNLSENLSPIHIDKWKGSLSGQQVNLLQNICKNCAESYDYPLISTNVSKDQYPGIKSKIGHLWWFVKNKSLYSLPFFIRKMLAFGIYKIFFPKDFLILKSRIKSVIK